MAKVAWIVIRLIALSGVLELSQMRAEDLQHLSRPELRRFIEKADKPLDYQKLAMYFHHLEQVYRAKADLEAHNYAKFFSRYHPKVQTASENAARLYDYYSLKADRQAEAAAGYDAMLTRSGIRPARVKQIVSLADLRSQTATRSVNSVPAPEMDAPREGGDLPKK
jgi:hypothetical protein